MNNKWKLVALSVCLLFFLNSSDSLAAHPGGGHPGGGGGGFHPHFGGGGAPHFHMGGGGMHFHFGGGHPISASAFRPATFHHVFHTGNTGGIFHTTVHRTVAGAALQHTTVHSAAAAGIAGAHPNFTMNPHPGVPRSAYNSFNHFHNGGGWNGGHWNGYRNGDGFDSFFGFPILFAFPDIYPFYYPYDDYDDDFGYPDVYDFFYQPQPADEVSQPVAQAPAASEQWIPAVNGNVPADAIVNSTENGVTTYYCRAEFNGTMYYGVLVPRDACYTQAQAVSLRFISYDVMVQ